MEKNGMKNQRIRMTRYEMTIPAGKPASIALVSDLHNIPCGPVIRLLSEVRPDYIAVNGDILCAAPGGKSIYHADEGSSQHIRNAADARRFLEESRKMAPVLFSTGNHELYFDREDRDWLKEHGILFLDNDYMVSDGLVFGGLSSPYPVLAGTGDASSEEEHRARWALIYDSVQTAWLDRFEKTPGFKILLSHHPEFYDRFLKERRGINLILAGHTHGGQIRFFGRGLYAYGQGWFPAYSKGCYDNRMIVSAGLANTSRIPRLNNPPELVVIQLVPGRRA